MLRSRRKWHEQGPVLGICADTGSSTVGGTSMSYLYLASPYTHADKAARQRRYEAVRAFTAFLCNRKEWVFSPILHLHDLAISYDLPYTFDFWDEWNKAMILSSRGVIVFQIDGWKESRGVTAEVLYAGQIGLPIILSKERWPSYDHK